MGTFLQAQLNKKSNFSRKRQVWKDEAGTAAVEFAIVAPILAAALIGMLDVGRLLYERSDVNSALRMAAQTAMSDPGTKKITDLLRTFKSQKQFAESMSFEYSAQRYCACPDNRQYPGTIEVQCDTPCPTADSPSIFYRIEGGTRYNGIFVQDYRISKSIEVQVQ